MTDRIIVATFGNANAAYDAASAIKGLKTAGIAEFGDYLPLIRRQDVKGFVHFFASRQQDEDAAVVLLGDIRDIFDGRRVDRLTSKTIVDRLNGADDAMWSEWRGIHGNQQPRERAGRQAGTPWAAHPASGSQPPDRTGAADRAAWQQAWSRQELQALGSRPLDRMDAASRAASQQAWWRRERQASGRQLLGRMEAAGWARLQQVSLRAHPASELQPLDRTGAADRAAWQQAWSRLPIDVPGEDSAASSCAGGRNLARARLQSDA
jgi:hypothetical protein